MGFHLIPNHLNLNFVGWRKISYILSVVLILAGAAYIALDGGLKYGIDFAGGATAHIQFSKDVDDEALKASLSGTNMPGLTVQRYGEGDTDYLIRVSAVDEASTGIRETIESALEKSLPNASFKILTLEMVGAKVGADLRAKALEAMFYATLLIAVYVSGRFERRWFAAAGMAVVLGGGMYLLDRFAGISKAYLIPLAAVLTILICWRLKLVFALGAIVSILHDVLITVGLFALMGGEFDLTTIAALLTTIGYSLNDTIIVYDRIRENLHGNKDTPFSVIVNRSINQTLSRTVLTSGTTLIVIACLLIWGGGAIFEFALIMFIGVLIGTASSIFVASPVLLAFGDETISLHRDDDKKKRKKLDHDGRAAPQV